MPLTVAPWRSYVLNDHDEETSLVLIYSDPFQSKFSSSLRMKCCVLKSIVKISYPTIILNYNPTHTRSKNQIIPSTNARVK